ncbi:winged helix-turn-helix transcriptional regulator [Cribrihabitans pelagius]|uniref:winged helix-turn-helix transcriptional regulator n=1 Tax=Cribrihabitans pelagius TaxID=1765746 RepID=UPI003B5AEAB8
MPLNVPAPGRPVRGSKSGKPIMALFDLLGRSWALGVVWQLSQRPMTFRQLQESCEGVSPTVLNKRLKELTARGLVTRCEAGYQLTATGTELFHLLKPLGAWSQTWAATLEDPGMPD